MSGNEKGQPCEGRPIPNCVVYHDATEHKATLQAWQASRLTRRCAISAAMAAILAPLIFGEVAR